MHTTDFIQDLAVIMLVAGVVTVLFHRFKQPVVLGYIVAGLIIGPHTPPAGLISSEDTIRTLAELGVVFLLLSLGLEFSWRKLTRVGATAIIAALTEIILMTWLGYEIGRHFGWSNIDALFLGAMLSISSTTITVKALEELGLKRERFAQLCFGILIVEDILAIAIIALLSSVAGHGTLDAAVVAATLLRLAIFLVVALVLGILIVPRLLTFVARFRSDEMLLITVLGLAFGFCLLVVKLDYSVALGAFVIGAVMAESRELKQIERLIAPLRDTFSAIFFVAVGLLIDPRVIFEHAMPVAVITLAVVLGKVVTRALGTHLAGHDGRTSMQVGVALAQIGEFSFIIAALGVTLKVTSDFLFPIAVAVAVITTFLTPYLIRAADPMTRALDAITPQPVTRFFNLYTMWLQGIQHGHDRSQVASWVRRILVHVLVNFSIVAAIFLSGAYVAGPESGLLDRWLPVLETRKALVWGSACLLSLPFLIAAYRKFKALSMILVEASLGLAASGSAAFGVRRILAEIIPVAAVGLMMLLVAALSASLLPPTELLLLVLAVVAVCSVLLWRRFVRWHSRLQIALRESSAPQDHDHST
ncbi:MAG: potassium transporter [Acidithiobacillales bacterium SM23_46]|jgi:CPA2 family monovalent cation:H+ antiporter-2|nr:MAG: potassium transporter [Acidithiobacillales bacterium SM23_46]